MARGVYSHELNDPDYSWLLTHFREVKPNYLCIEAVGVPVVFIDASNSNDDALSEENHLLMPFADSSPVPEHNQNE